MSLFYTVALRHEAEKQFGERQSTEVAKRACVSALKKLRTLPLPAHPAFGHIAEHFRPQPSKPSHGVFLPEFQKPDVLARLLAETISHQGMDPMLSKSDDRDWAVLIQKWFGQKQIGEDARRTKLTYVCLIVQLNGDLVTAYPVDSYRAVGTRLSL